MEELLTAATVGILRHVAAEEMTEEMERQEVARRWVEEQRWAATRASGRGRRALPRPGLSCCCLLVQRQVPGPPPAPPHTAAGSGGASGLGARVGLAVCLSGRIGGQGLPT